MANFATHVGVAVGVGASLATGLTTLGYIPWDTGLNLLIFFVFGTLLPDIDVDNARPVRWVFNLFALFAALLTFSALTPTPSSGFWFSHPAQPGWPAFIGALAVWLIIRYPLSKLFQKLTRHRGLAHSLIVGLLWSLAWLHFAHWQFSGDSLVFWLQALALLGGFLLHLALDEIYSVDIEGIRIKRSFGSAMKVLDRRFMSGSIAVIILNLIMILALPNPEALLLWLKLF
ncbi:metal-dependent hydrolase [Marinospirillum sp. MEB164]|uniref:Metal-dependent hydrolase n=1 Tax=Marinospirillum alkalitolerans TaxID=3123374 RepID=A0ABW8PWT7_9GAMM